MKTITCKNTRNLRGITTYPAMPFEIKMGQIFENNEPIKADVGLIFTERKEGVMPEYDIRTDRWDYAAKASDKVSMEALAKREKTMKSKENVVTGTSQDGVQATTVTN